MTDFKKITEDASHYDALEHMSTATLLKNINEEDQKVAKAVALVIPQITQLVDALADKFLLGGRLFYIGAGTSGRLGILDASEIPPTFGLPHDRVIGIIAGGIPRSGKRWNLQKMIPGRHGWIFWHTGSILWIRWWVLQHRGQRLMCWGVFAMHGTRVADRWDHQ